jgi:hypothetical protein
MPTHRSVDLSWLIGGERLYPFDPPTKQELKQWYLASILGVFAPAAIVATLCYGWLRLRKSNSAASIARMVFAGVWFVAGIAGMPWLNRLGYEFIFTWPASLFIAWQMSLGAALWARRQPDPKRARRLARLAGVAFLAVAFAYFHLCWKLGMAIEWVFLIGLPLSSPATAGVAYQLDRRTGLLSGLFWIFASFSLYYLR